MATAIDPIRLEVVRNAATSAIEEMADTTRRAANSTNITLGELVIEPVAGAPTSNVDQGVLAAGTPM
jgi:hypothetical protein